VDQPASAPAADGGTPTPAEDSKSSDDSASRGASSAARREAQPVTGNGKADARSHVGEGIEQLFKNNVFSLYIVAERREPIAGVELLNAAVKIGLDFGDHGIFHRVHPESGESIFSMANLTAPGSFDPTAWNLFETRGVSLFMPLPGPLGAMNGWDTMLASAERLSSLLSARIVNARREPMSRQQVAQIREQMRQFDRRRQ
jgi:cell division protein ZipA